MSICIKSKYRFFIALLSKKIIRGRFSKKLFKEKGGENTAFNYIIVKKILQKLQIALSALVPSQTNHFHLQKSTMQTRLPFLRFAHTLRIYHLAFFRLSFPQ